MTRFINQLTLLNRYGLILVVALSFCVTPTFAQDGDVEPPVPEEEPVLEDEDDVVIPDVEEEGEEVIVDEDDEVVIADDEEDDLVLEEEPELSAEELAAKADAERRAWEKELGQRTLDAANAAATAGKWREAATKYSEASQYLPNNPEIIRGLQHAYSMLDQSQLLTDYQDRIQMSREEARAVFMDAMASANERLLREDYDTARQIVAGALARLNRDRTLFSEDEYGKKRATATALNYRIGQLQEAWLQHRLVTQAEERSRDQEIRQSEQSRKRSQMINDNMKRIRQLQRERKYGQAIEIIDEILFIDQHNVAAIALREALQHTQQFEEWMLDGKAKNLGVNSLFGENNNALIPPRKNFTGPGDKSTTGIMTYPSEWENLTQLRYGTQAGFSETYQNRAIKVAMDKTTGSSHDIEDRTLDDVLTEIKNASGIPGDFFIDWATLEAMDTDYPVTPTFVIKSLEMGDVSLIILLERILNYVNIKNNPDNPLEADAKTWFGMTFEMAY